MVARKEVPRRGNDEHFHRQDYRTYGSSFALQAFGRRGMQKNSTLVHGKLDLPQQPVVSNCTTFTNEHLNPNGSTSQGWRFATVTSWSLWHTRGSRQDILSTRVMVTTRGLWRAPNQTTGAPRAVSDVTPSLNHTVAEPSPRPRQQSLVRYLREGGTEFKSLVPLSLAVKEHCHDQVARR